MRDQGTPDDGSGAEDGRARATKIIRDWAPTIGTLTAAIVAFVGFVFVLIPRLKPEPPPPELAVQLSNVALEERFTDDQSDEWLIVTFDTVFTGYKGNKIPVGWAAFDPTGKIRTPLDPAPEVGHVPSDSAQPSNWDGGSIKAEAQADQASVPIRVPVPKLAQCLVIRVYLYDEDFTRLAYADSKPFLTHDPSDVRCPLAVSAATPEVIRVYLYHAATPAASASG